MPIKEKISPIYEKCLLVSLPFPLLSPHYPSVPINRRTQAGSVFVPHGPKGKKPKVRVTPSPWPTAIGAGPGSWPDNGF